MILGGGRGAWRFPAPLSPERGLVCPEPWGLVLKCMAEVCGMGW